MRRFTATVSCLAIRGDLLPPQRGEIVYHGVQILQGHFLVKACTIQRRLHYLRRKPGVTTASGCKMASRI